MGVIHYLFGSDSSADQITESPSCVSRRVECNRAIRVQQDGDIVEQVAEYLTFPRLGQDLSVDIARRDFEPEQVEERM